MIQETDFNTVLHLVSKQLQMPVSGVNTEETKKLLTEAGVTEDEQTSLTFSESSAEISQETLLVLDVVIRVTNATWKASQIHRAQWEGTTDRIDSDKREAYDVFDTLKHVQFEKVRAEAQEKGLPNPEIVALYRVAFEVWKDIRELKEEVKGR